VPLVYASATLSLAALEILVHADVEHVQGEWMATPAEIPDALRVRDVSARELPPDWRSVPAPAAVTDLGTAWARARETAVLAVPSAIIPHERNFVVNPLHPAFRTVRVGTPQPFSFDPRLWTRRRGTRDQ